MTKALVLVLSALSLQTLAATDKWTQMRVKYGPTEEASGVEYLWKVPNTLSEALESDFKYIVEENKDTGCTLVAVDPYDFGFTPCYDGRGNLAGAQLCQPLHAVISTQPETYSPLAQGTVELKTMQGRLYFCSTFLLVDPKILASGGRDHIDKSIGVGLWVRDTTDPIQKFKKIPDNVQDLLETTPYTLQACFPAMGVHYFYNFTEEFDCNGFYNWFLLSQDDSISGIGLQFMGVPEVISYDWYDFLPRIAAEMIAPNVNVCLYDWVEQYGITSVHVFFQDEPWNIDC